MGSDGVLGTGNTRYSAAGFDNLTYGGEVGGSISSAYHTTLLSASVAVNELLARLHSFRDDGKSEFAVQTFSLTQARLITAGDGVPCRVLDRHIGRVDTTPLLGAPEPSEVPAATAA